MKIIHLSDTHVGRPGNAERFSRVVDDILALGDPGDYVVVHTGDVIDRGIPQEMPAGRDILDKLASRGWRILLAPGNHDYGDALHVSADRAKVFRQFFADYIFGEHPVRFPVLNLIGDCAFIGLDSNAGELGFLTGWLGLAEGCLGKDQLAALSVLLDAPEVRDRYIVAYLHHHPFFDAYVVQADVDDGHYFSHLLGLNTRRFRRLKDAYSLLQCIRDRVDLLLFGHQHFGLDYCAEGRRYGIPRAFDASSTTCTEMDTDRMRYRIIDTESKAVTTRFIPLGQAIP